MFFILCEMLVDLNFEEHISGDQELRYRWINIRENFKDLKDVELCF